MADWTYNYKRTDEPPAGSVVTLTLTEDCQQTFRDNGLFSWLEIEMMQGTKELLPDGRTRFRFSLDPEKDEILKGLFVSAALPKN